MNSGQCRRADIVRTREFRWSAVAGALLSRPRLVSFLILACGAGLILTPESGNAARVTLKSGIELEGDVAPLSTMVAGATSDGEDDGKSIVFVDDGIRRYYVSLHQVKQVINDAGNVQQKINVPQPLAAGRQITALGPYLEKPTEIDRFGRRRIKIRIQEGPVDIVQGITLITPRYYKLQTVVGGHRLLLEQSYATSNLPSRTLKQVLDYALQHEKPEARLGIVRLYLQAERYSEAQQELESLLKNHPKLPGLDAMLQELRQFQARTVLSELKLRGEAGQHQLVRAVLEKFPSDGVAGETLFQVREMLKGYVEREKQVEAVARELQQRTTRIKDESTRAQIAPLVDEICADLGHNTLSRLAAYRRLADDPALGDSEKMSLALSGWLLGTDDATNNLSVTLSLIHVRELVRQYINEELKTRRDRLADDIRSQEGGQPRFVARLLSAMPPPSSLPEPRDGLPGYYEITIPGRDKEPDTTYFVQLPPQYDPYRRYPAILTLHGENTTAPVQVDWWAGAANKQTGHRLGQAMRNGYIVIAPLWSKMGQRAYRYSAREHAVVLDVLRDACRRLSIDTDRVFLTGHGIGGDAAWDLALAHPDLWAGVIPIVATADAAKYNYCRLYWQNGRYVPMYFIGGDYDGQKLAKNAPLWDRYLRSNKFDATVVQFIGRGQESFSDEVVRIFEWAARHKRDFYPKEFECATLRSFDNYFWWIEINRFHPGLTVDPDDWPGKGIRPLKVTGSIRTVDGGTIVRASTGRSATTIWLMPELVDFSRRVRVELTGRNGEVAPKPDIAVILEDARTRGDRQHPFWARVDFP